MNVFVQLESDLVRLEECQRGMGVDKVASISWQGRFFPKEMFGNHLEISHEIWMNNFFSKIYHCYCMAIYLYFLMSMDFKISKLISKYWEENQVTAVGRCVDLDWSNWCNALRCWNILYIQYFSRISIAISLNYYI